MFVLLFHVILTTMVLKVCQVSKKYDSQQVLNSVSFTIGKGEIVGFLGPNGAGKSTTMKIISGCLSADEGTVHVGNHDLSKEPLKAKALLGYLPEDNPLYGEMYIVEYLEYVARLYGQKGSFKEKINETIAQTALGPEIHKKIGQLSRGYRQRVGLAQAIIHTPDLLILDEPASGLDPNQIDEMNELLVDLSKEKAILFSSHTLSEVQAICTRIIMIHRGNIMVDQPVEEIPDLQSLFKQKTLG